MMKSMKLYRRELSTIVSSRTTNAIELELQKSAHNYHPIPVVINRGLGCNLWDVEGTKYLDMLSGYGVFGLGRNHPEIRQILKDFLDGALATALSTPCSAPFLGVSLIVAFINLDMLSK